MRIGIVCYPTYGGSGIIATELASHLSKDHEVHLVSYEEPVRSERDMDFSFHEVDILTYPLFKYPPYTLALASELAEVVETYDLDLIHVHYAVPNSASAYLAREISGAGTKVVTTLHGTDSYLVGKHPSYRRATEFSMQKSDALTAVSEYLRKKTLDEFNISREIEVIPNFVDPEKFKNIEKPSDRKIICHSSNFRPVKRIPDIIRAFRKITKEVNSNLFLIGDGPEREKAEKMADDFGILDKICFFGNVKNVQDILGKADLFLLPSEEESFGLAALEAMSCEVPVIASRTGGLVELISHGQDGYLVEKGDVESLARYAVKVLGNPDHQRELAENARGKVLEKYASEKAIKKYEELYRKTLEK